VTIDVGTGDGRAVLLTAAASPAGLAIGLDAHAPAMAEASRRAARPALKGGLPNAMFLLAAAETMPREMHGIADLVTVRFPWGSLLRGCLGLDDAAATGIARLVKPGGELEILLAPADRDGLDGIPTEPGDVAASVAATFTPRDFELLEARPATAMEITASGSSWARRLLAGGGGGLDRRPVTLVRMRSSRS
jgi:16S rRNA (adenine(1408)-N(1))-methyltransferase